MNAHEPEDADLAARRRRAVRPVLAVVALSVLLSLLVVASQTRLILRSRGSHAIGDGRNPDTYGFDLSTCLVSRQPATGGYGHEDGSEAGIFRSPNLLRPAGRDFEGRERRRPVD